MTQKTGAPGSAHTTHRADLSPNKHSRGRRGIVFWLGVLLVLGGLGTLGYVAWQLYGTNIVSKQTQERLVGDLEQQWEKGGATEAARGKPYSIIRIPAFGKDYAVPVLQGVGNKQLASGFGHFPETAGPGEVGNYALAGHRVTHGEPLRDMPELRPGDEVIVETRDTVFTYELDTDPNDLIVTFTDIWVVDPLPVNPDGGVQPAQDPGQRLITLTTCSELFHTDNRMIAFGHLVDTEAKVAAPAG